MKYPFSETKHYGLMKGFWDSRKNFIVLGLCGKTGSGCTTVADILQKSFEQLNMPVPADSSGNSIEDNEYRILYTYAKIHWRPFYRIKTSALITAHVLKYPKEDFLNFIKKFIPGAIEQRNMTILGHIVDCFFDAEMCFDLNALFQIDPSDIENAHTWLESDQYPHQPDGQRVSFTLRSRENNIPLVSTQISSKKSEYIKCTLNFQDDSIQPIEFSYDKNSASCFFKTKDLYTLFQEYHNRRTQKKGFDNPLLICLLQQFIFDYLPVESKRLWTNLATTIPDVQVTALQQLGNHLRISGKPYNTDFVAEAYATIVVDINAAIKLLNASLVLKKEWIYIKKTQYLENYSLVVIDSIKNPFESMYLKDRYTNYYLLGIYTEDNIRCERLRKYHFFSDSHIHVINIIEQIKEFKRQYKAVLKSVENFERVSPIDDMHQNLNDFILEYKNICSKEAEQLQTNWHNFNKLPFILPDDCFHILENIRVILDKSISDRKNSDVELKLRKKYDSWLTQVERAADEVPKFSPVVIESIRIIYGNQLFDELPFILQNVGSCLENADIFINNVTDSRQYIQLKRKLIRYVSLIMNPGLVLPSPVERCMQLAYTAKLNSGCISRQVGAAITDAEYHLLSIGWNQQPEGQIPCSYRDLCSLYYHWSPEAYSDYECDDLDQIQKNIKAPVTELLDTSDCPLTLQGKLPAYCFKDIYNSIMGNVNQVHPRSLHAEETAFLNLGQHSAQGGILFTTSSPCELCAKKAKYKGISKIYYIEPYSGISLKHVLNIGAKSTRPKMLLFTGAIGRAYTQLYTPLLPKKDELTFWLGANLDVNILKQIQKKQRTEKLNSVKQGNDFHES